MSSLQIAWTKALGSAHRDAGLWNRPLGSWKQCCQVSGTMARTIIANAPTGELLAPIANCRGRGGVRNGVHALRHGFCAELVRSNVGVETVRVLAGHEDLRTTRRYLRSERSDLVQAMETFAK